MADTGTYAHVIDTMRAARVAGTDSFTGRTWMSDGRLHLLEIRRYERNWLIDHGPVTD